MSNFLNFIEETSGVGHLRVEDHLGDGYVRLHVAEAEKRQAKHDIQSSEDILIEMLRNARDASAKHIFVALAKEGSTRSICMVDDGVGIPEHLQEKIFEPRVTSKLDSMHVDTWGVHGRGMALYSISLNAEKAYVARSDRNRGSALYVETDVNKLPERTDQSSIPAVRLKKDGSLVIRGAKNLNRTLIEFILTEQQGLVVYAGSPLDIIATLYHLGCSAFDSLPDGCIMKDFARCTSPAELQSQAKDAGLFTSERSARRVLDGVIAPLEPFISVLDKDSLKSGATSEPQAVDISKDSRGLRLDESYKQDFLDDISHAYDKLARAHYLDPGCEPSLSLDHDELVIRIPLHKLR